MFRKSTPLRRRLEDISEINADSVELGLLDQDVSGVSITQTYHVADHRCGCDRPREAGSTGKPGL
jgi:hypothetical protein